MPTRWNRRQRQSRILESLESRTLLAGDLCCVDNSATQLPVVVDPPAEEFSASNVAATDAGSTRSTAHDIGVLTGTRTLGGSVGRRDPSDVVRFEIPFTSQVSIRLDNVATDLDLSLYNADGNRIAVSNRGSLSAETLQGRLPAGTYYVEVAPWRRLTASDYRLVLSAFAIDSQPSEPPAEPPATAPTDPPADVPDGAAPFEDVPYYGGANDWYVNRVGATEAWADGYTGEGVVVAVIDTGVDLDHPDLVTNLWVNADEIPGNGIDDDGNGFVDDVRGWDFANGDNDPDDTNGHGTHVAGTVAALANGQGATGVAPGATVMPVQVLGDSGGGSSFSVASGIRYAADNGADIINLSLGGGFSNAIRSAVAYASSLGVFVVAAAGNESAAVPSFPARYSADFGQVLSVGAHSSVDRIAGFSNAVGNSGAVQVDAPGVGVFSTYVGGGYRSLSGTSMASPNVAGVAALTLSANPNLTPSQLRSLIVDGSHRTIDGSDSLGGVDAAHTVAFAAAGLTGSGVATQATGTPTARGITAARRVQVTSIGTSQNIVLPSQLSEASTSHDTLSVASNGTVEIARFQAELGSVDRQDAAATDRAFAEDDAEPWRDLISAIDLWGEDVARSLPR